MQRQWHACLGTLAVLMLAGLALVPAAEAHVFPDPTYLETETTSSVELFLPNERRIPMTAFELRVPAGLRVEEAAPADGWTSAATAKQATWTGGSLPPFANATFSVRLAVSRAPGNVTLEAVERYPDGRHVSWPVTLVVVPADEPSQHLGVAVVVGLVGLLGLTVAAALLWRRSGRSLQEK
jgi:uncharacterized protein YcnI